MPLNIFPRTIDGTTNLKLNDLEVTGEATLNEITGDIEMDGDVSNLIITDDSGQSFTVQSLDPATTIYTASSVIRGGLGVVKNIIVGDTLKVESTTASTSLTTGSIVTAGGIGAAGRVSANSVFVKNAGITSNGDDLFLNGVFSNVALRPNFSADGQLLNTPSLLQVNDLTTTPIFTINKTSTATNVKKLVVEDTTASTSVTTGAAIISGGAGVGGRVTAGSFGLGNTTITTTANDVIIQGNNDAIYLKPASTINGELINSPTVFTIKNNAGTIVHSLDKATNRTSLNTLTITSTTDSTSPTTGAVICAGGIGTNVIRANFAAIKNVTFLSNNDDLFIVANNAEICLRPTPATGNGQLKVDTTQALCSDASGNSIWRVDKASQATLMYKIQQIISTTASTSSTTGAATFVGGIGIANTTNATSATNGGSLTTAGGIASAQDIYAGGKVQATGTLIGADINFTGNTGTFTPIILSDTTITYTTQSGFFYRIGKMAFFTLTVVTTSALYISSGVNLSVAGIPFNGANVGNQTLAAPYLDNFALPTSTDYVVSQMTFGNNNVTFIAIRDGLAPVNVTAPTTSGTRTIRLSCWMNFA